MLSDKKSRYALVGYALGALISTTAAGATPVQSWISTWAATPAPRWGEELPPAFNVPEILTNQTVRQIVRTSVGGIQLRVVISNQFGIRPLTIGAATVALSSGSGAIDPATLRLVTFGGKPSAVIPPGAPFISDPVDLATRPLSNVAVSIYLPKKTAVSSVHWDGVQTAYISGPGDKTRDATFTPDGTTKSRLFLSAVLSNAKPDSAAVVFFGDSITDGACSTPDTNNRWPDHIAERLQAEGHADIAVVNEAYSGNRVLMNGMGTNAVARFDMSVLSHPRISTVIMLMGINDIGWPGKDSPMPTDQEPSADDIIGGYMQIIERAHEHGLRFVAATLTPFAGSFQGTPISGYYTPEKEAIREDVNAWIRGNKTADGLIDFDKVLADPKNPKHINPVYDCGDHLHPNDAGYQAMAQAVDLMLLVPKVRGNMKAAADRH